MGSSPIASTAKVLVRALQGRLTGRFGGCRAFRVPLPCHNGSVDAGQRGPEEPSLLQSGEKGGAFLLGQVLDDHLLMRRQWPSALKELLDRQLEARAVLRPQRAGSS